MNAPASTPQERAAEYAHRQWRQSKETEAAAKAGWIAGYRAARGDAARAAKGQEVPE